jgi:hypothetical protein
MTETTEAASAKPKLTRKAIKATQSDGVVTTYDSIKAASIVIGHTHSLLMRMAATGEADQNGTKYALVDYVPKAVHKLAAAFSEETWAVIEAAALSVGLQPGPFVVNIVEGYFEERGLIKQAA